MGRKLGYMALFQTTVIIAFVVSAVLVIVSNAESVDVSFDSSACNGRGIDLLSDYARARDIALYDSVKNTPNSEYNYYGKGIYNFGVAFSHGRCLGSLSKDQCERCMEVAKSQMIASCAFNTEGWVQLKDCFISYWEFPNH